MIKRVYIKLRQHFFGMRIRIVLKSGYVMNLSGLGEFKFTVGGSSPNYSLKWKRAADCQVVVIAPEEIAAVEWLD